MKGGIFFSRKQLAAVSQPHKRLNLVHHPALIGLVIEFFTEASYQLTFYSHMERISLSLSLSLSLWPFRHRRWRC